MFELSSEFSLESFSLMIQNLVLIVGFECLKIKGRFPLCLRDYFLDWRANFWFLFGVMIGN